MIMRGTLKLRTTSLKHFSRVIKLDFMQLSQNETSSEIHHKIEEAFGRDKLGLIVIKNIPNYIKARRDFLNKAYEFSCLKEEILRKYERPETGYHIGWALGKIETEGEREALTAHYYARINSEHLKFPSDPKREKLYTNVWPNEEEIQDFKKNYLAVGRILHECQCHLMRHLDNFIVLKAKTLYPNKSYNYTLSRISKGENDVLGRMVVNFPGNQAHSPKFNNWVGWHRDFGCVTGLTRAMYFKKDGSTCEVRSGLLVKNKQNSMIDLEFEEDEIVLQTGDASFILSGGILIPTPHSVKITKDIPRDVTRVTFALFHEPEYEFKMEIPFGLNSQQVFSSDPFKMMESFTQYNENCNYNDFIGYAVKAFFKSG